MPITMRIVVKLSAFSKSWFSGFLFMVSPPFPEDNGSILRCTALWKSNIDTKHDIDEWNSTLITETKVLERPISFYAFFSSVELCAQNITRDVRSRPCYSESGDEKIETSLG